MVPERTEPMMRIKWPGVLTGITAMLLLTLQAASQVSSPTTPAAAEQQFAKLCAGCHGEGAVGTDRGPALANNRAVRSRPENQVRDLIQKGTPRGMPPFPL